MYTDDLQTNQSTNQQTYNSITQPITKQPLQQPPAVNKANQSNKTLMLVFAGLGTGLGYILSFIISDAVFTLLQNNMDAASVTAFGLISHLTPVLSFFINAVIIMIGGAISCKKANDLLKFFACCISGQTVATFIGNAIISVLTAVCYFKGTDIPAYIYSQISVGAKVFCAVIAAVLSVLILSIVSKETSVTSAYTDTQNGVPLNSDGETLPLKSPKSRGVAIVLCIFLGALGIHRFYTEKVGTGILWLLTGGLFGIGTIVDFFMLLFGAFTDNSGRRL
ncbi:MAG: TM2 domain-containing protein [Acutalibacteraceae bacterium]